MSLATEPDRKSEIINGAGRIDFRPVDPIAVMAVNPKFWLPGRAWN